MALLDSQGAAFFWGERQQRSPPRHSSIQTQAAISPTMMSI